MTSGRTQASVLASPVLVGAVTVLIAVVAVFLSYNANSGLPFVPTYKVNVRVPDAAGLVQGNEVRVGGKRVGVIKEIDAVPEGDGTPSANLDLALETRLDPIRSDTTLIVRPRSPLGLKYLEMKPGASGKPIAANGTLPMNQATENVELDQALNTFDTQTRIAAQKTLNEIGPGIAGRGKDFNAVVALLPELFQGVDRFNQNLASPETNLAGFISGANAFVGELAAAGAALGHSIEVSDVTAGALAAADAELAEGIAESPSTETAGINALRVARPVLDDAGALAKDIRPGARLLKPAAVELDRAIDAGIPVVRRALALADDLEGTLAAVAALSGDPLTRKSLARLRRVLDSALPTLRYVEPFQTRCNYLGVWTRNATSAVEEGDASGNWFRTVVVLEPDEMFPSATPADRLHNSPTPKTGQDGQCQPGNEAWVPGRQIGEPPGPEAGSTELTGPPAGTPRGPR